MIGYTALLMYTSSPLSQQNVSLSYPLNGFCISALRITVAASGISGSGDTGSFLQLEAVNAIKVARKRVIRYWFFILFVVLMHFRLLKT